MDTAPHCRMSCCALLAIALAVPAALLAVPQPPQETPPGSVITDDAYPISPELASARRQIEAGHFHEAIATLQTLAQGMDDSTDARRRARVLGTLGIALNFVGAYGEAIEVQHRALALYESIDHPAGITAVTLNLGSSLSHLGDVAGARRHYERALALKQAHGIESGVGVIHQRLAELADAEGDLDGAEAASNRALEAFARAPAPAMESLTRSSLAQLLARRQQHEAAMEQIGLAERLAISAGSARAEATARAAHAEVLIQHARSGDLDPHTRTTLLDQAEHALQRAVVTNAAQESPHWRATLLESLSELYELKGDPAAALEQLRQARELQSSLRQRTDLARAGMLSAGYEFARQQREIHRLQGQEVRSSAALVQQRRGLLLLAALLLTSLGLALMLWRRNRLRQAMAAQLHEHNQALAHSVEQAQRERQRAEAFAMRQRRFLRLASEDLRGPLLEMRTLAERTLVDENPEARRRTNAAIAQHAADLLWVTEQMLESASQEDRDASTAALHEAVDLVPMLRDIVDQATPRALHFDQHLEFRSSLTSAPAQLERTRCTVALRELLDILLYSNPPRTRFILDLREEHDGQLRLGMSAGIARLPDWQDITMGHEIGDVTLRLALSWIQHTVQDNGGRISTERSDQDSHREVVIRFPRDTQSPPAATAKG